jgi:hypothetical protein
VGYDFNPAAQPPAIAWPEFLAGFEAWLSTHLALFMMLIVSGMHMFERFLWHVIWDRQFPDWWQGE